MLGHAVRSRRPNKRRKTTRPYCGQLPPHLDRLMGEANILYATGELEKVL